MCVYWIVNGSLYSNFVFTLVFRPMKMPEIQIICLFIFYKPHVYIGVYLK